MTTATKRTVPITLLAPFLLMITSNLTAQVTEVGTASANLEPAPKGKPEAPTNPGLRQIQDTPGLPRVLIIGDSISVGYMLETRAKLTGRANVHHPPVNCGPSERGLANVDEWLGTGPWDVIYFNFGLHDLKYLDAKGAYVSPAVGKVYATPEQYADNLRAIVGRLRQTKAKLIFATTTPVPIGATGRIPGGEKPYNAKAIEVMNDCGVAVDDLAKVVGDAQAALPPLPPRPRKLEVRTRAGDPQLMYDVHFTPAGYSMLAASVTASIEAALPAKETSATPPTSNVQPASRPAAPNR